MSGAWRFGRAQSPPCLRALLCCGIVMPALTIGPRMTEFDPTQHRLIPHGHSFEEFELGRTFEHHWGRTINEGDNSLFSTATLAYNPLYFNAEYARVHGHPNTVVNPFLVLCTVVGRSVEDLSEAGGPFLGIDELTFHRPVYPGDPSRRAAAWSRRANRRRSRGSGS